MTSLSFKELPLLFCLLLLCLSQQFELSNATEENKLVVDHSHEAGSARTSIENLGIIDQEVLDGERSENTVEKLDDTSFPTTESPKQSNSRISSASLNERDANDQEKKLDSTRKTLVNQAFPASKNKIKHKAILDPGFSPELLQDDKSSDNSSDPGLESAADKKQISKVENQDKNKKDKMRVIATPKKHYKHQEVQDTDTIIALVVTKKGSFSGRKLNNKAIDKILSFNQGTLRIGDKKSLKVPLSATSVFPSGTYYMKRAIRFAGLHLV